MAKQLVQASPKSTAALEELGTFLEFCCDFGYRYNEADLYNFKSYAWQQYNKFTQGKNARDMWAEDARRLNRNI
jgi:hypothetical protein